MQTQNVSRRNFLQGAGLGLAGVAAAGLGLGGCAPKQKDLTFEDTIAWNASYDVVVVGFGAAGGVSSVYAADAGAQVLLCDIAPEGEEGGNSRFAAQMCVGGTDPDKTFDYYRNGLPWKFDVDDELLRTYTDGLNQMPDLMKYLGASEPFQTPNGTVTTPEYPGYSGGDAIVEWYVYKGMYNSSLWQTIRKNVTDRLDKIDVWLESPAKRLIQDPLTKTIVGVEIERKGEKVLVHAKKGVVLSCGGFENNRQMIQDYLGRARLTPLGTLHNNGDGIRLGMQVGADLHHMDAFESLGILSGNAWAVPEGHRAKLEPAVHNLRAPLLSLESEDYGKGSIILVGDDGGRFINEFEVHRHGHVYSNGVWRNPIASYEAHLVFDKTQYQALKDDGYITEEREASLVSADTPEQLAKLINVDVDIFTRTISDFNEFAREGRDYKFERAAESMRPFDGGPLYAAAFQPVILNTQGGPRRNKDAEVLDIEGNPLPRLYSAGELGGITAFQYNSGGNLAECMVFGKIAGSNAATSKDPLPTLKAPQAAKADMKYTAGSTSDINEEDDTTNVSLSPGEYLGVGSGGMGGNIKVKVGYANGTISAIDVVSQKETPDIGGKALEKLPGMVISANSTKIDAVSGATLTSKAFFAAVDDALSQA